MCVFSPQQTDWLPILVLAIVIVVFAMFAILIIQALFPNQLS